MPQIDFSTYIPQLFWLAISFLALYLFVQLYFAPRIGHIVGKRKKEMLKLLSEADETNQEADEALFKAEQILEQAKNEGKKIKQEAAQKIEAIIKEILEKNKVEVQQLLGEGEAKAKFLQDKLMGSVEDMVEEVKESMYNALKTSYNMNSKGKNI